MLELDLRSDRSTGFFILTIDSQFNALGEIIPNWNLSNDLHDLCTKFSVNCVVSSCLFILGSPKSNAHALRFAVVSYLPESSMVQPSI